MMKNQKDVNKEDKMDSRDDSGYDIEINGEKKDSIHIDINKMFRDVLRSKPSKDDKLRDWLNHIDIQFDFH